MNDRSRTLLSWSILALGALVMVPIVLLIRWGGRVEATLLMFGEPLFVSVDAGHPRILFLLVLPIALIGGALYVRVGRARK